MAIGSGNSSPKNGLAFAYDMHNPKSWKGAPTTNVVADALPTTGYIVTNYLDSAATVSFINEGGIPYLEISDVTRATGSTSYPRITASNFLTSTITDGFSVSFEAKGVPNEQIIFSIYSSGSTKVSLTATLTNGWTKYTFENQSSGFTLDRIYLRFGTDITGPVSIRNMQVEQSTVTTPFVEGTRSATESLIDLSGNHTITINSLTTDSNNEFSFNGTSDFMTMDGGKANYEMKNKSYTVEAVIKLDALSRVNGIISDLQYAWWVFRIGSDNAFFARHKYSDVITGPQATSTTVFNSTDYYHVAATFEHGGGMKVFVNGVKEAETDSTLYRNLLGFNLDNRGLMYIGQDRSNAPGSPTYFQGKIPMLKIYNNYVMREIDVKKSFNAIRGRYGI